MTNSSRRRVLPTLLATAALALSAPGVAHAAAPDRAVPPPKAAKVHGPYAATVVDVRIARRGDVDGPAIG